MRSSSCCVWLMAPIRLLKPLNPKAPKSMNHSNQRNGFFSTVNMKSSQDQMTNCSSFKTDTTHQKKNMNIEFTISTAGDFGLQYNCFKHIPRSILFDRKTIRLINHLGCKKHIKTYKNPIKPYEKWDLLDIDWFFPDFFHHAHPTPLSFPDVPRQRPCPSHWSLGTSPRHDAIGRTSKKHPKGVSPLD